MHENAKPGDTRSLARLHNRINMPFLAVANPLPYLNGKEGVDDSSPKGSLHPALIPHEQP